MDDATSGKNINRFFVTLSGSHKPERADLVQVKECLENILSFAAVSYAGVDPNVSLPETATITIVDYAELSGAVLTVDGFQLIEGEDWGIIATNEDTAGELWTALNLQGIVDADVVSNVITVSAPFGNQYTLETSDPVNLEISGPTLSGGIEAAVATFIGQLCKATTAWWQWDGSVWIPRNLLTGEPITTDGTNYYAITHDGSSLGYTPFP
jgi:hypothetical protein